MSKLLFPIAAASLAGLASCFPPLDMPPSHYRRDRLDRPERVRPYDDLSERNDRNDISPPPYQPQPYPSQPAPSRPPASTGGYPTAERTANPDQVLSPYEPYNVIDVAGFKSGQLARDPSNQKIFRIP